MEKNEIKQTSTLGSENTQIGIQNNNFFVGEPITMDKIVSMINSACSMYYPILKEEMLDSIYKTVTDELNKRQATVLTKPSFKVLIPALQNFSISEEQNLKEMYGKLLARAMDSVSADEAHPAFVEIINQMSSFDAILFKKIIDIDDSIPIASITFNFDNKYFSNVLPHFYSLHFDEFDDVWNVSFGLENLARLNIVNLFEGSVRSYDYNQIKNSEYVLSKFKEKKEDSKIDNLEIQMRKYVIQINDFGRRFAKMCL